METVCDNSTFFFICLTVELPKILFVSQQVTVYPGEPVELFCKTNIDDSSNPGSTSFQSIQWLDSNKNILSNRSSLKIENPTSETSGSYTCRVTNIAGAVEKSTSIHVLNPPEWVTVQVKETTRLVNDSNVCIICKSGASDPQVELTWTAARFGYNSLGSKNSTSLFQTYDTDGYVAQKQICFHLLESAHDQMEMQCNVFYLNKLAKTEHLRLDVEYPPYLKKNLPHDHLLIPKNDSTTLICPIVPGKPYGFVSWTGLPLKDSQYEVITVKFEKSGDVKCCRKNIHGSRCFSYQITIVEHTSIISLWPSSYVPNQGQPITFNCKIIHDKRNPIDPLQVIWKQGTKILHNSQSAEYTQFLQQLSATTTLSTITLTYTHPMFGKNLSCTVKQPNQKLTSASFSFAHVIEAPSQLWTLNDNSLDVMWDWNGDYVISYYALNYVTADVCDISKQDIIKLGTRITCQNSPFSMDRILKENDLRHYCITVQACDDFSCSGPSPVLTVTSDELHVPQSKVQTHSNITTVMKSGKPPWGEPAVVKPPPKDATIGFMVYACVFTIFAASLFTSLFAFWLINKFSNRDPEQILPPPPPPPRPSIPMSRSYHMNDDLYYMPNNTPYQFAIQRKMDDMNIITNYRQI